MRLLLGLLCWPPLGPPAKRSPNRALPPLGYAASDRLYSGGAPLTFAVRTAAPDGSVVIRVSGHYETDADGLLTG